MIAPQTAPSSPPTARSSPPPVPSSQEVFQGLSQKKAEFESQQTVGPEQKLDANPWVNRTGWAEHLEGFERETIAQWLEKPSDEEITLGTIYHVCRSVVDKSQRYMTSAWCPFFTRVAINRKDGHKDPSRPFEARMEVDTKERYIQVWQRMIGYIYRTFRGEHRPSYMFRPSQQAAWEAFVAMVEGLDAEEVEELREPAEPSPDEPPQLTRIEQSGLQAWISWLDDGVAKGHYANPIVSATAVLGYDSDRQTWASALDYTPKLSAIIKLARMMVVMDGWDRNQSEPEQVLGHIQSQVGRFMTTGQASPMNWMYMLRTYGQRIRYTTTAGGSVRWEGDTISYGRTKFSMHQFRTWVHGMVNQCWGILVGELLLEGEREGIPSIPWDALHDYPGEAQKGFSFIQDRRNRWPVSGDQWLFHKVINSDHRREFMAPASGSVSESGSHPRPSYTWEARRIRLYMKSIHRFKEKLAILIHTSSGQPARAPELLSIRSENTVNGGIRNVFMENGQIAIVTAYHKGYQIDNSVKIIHRYLPREVGEILVYYLWLVQPFQRLLELAIHEKMWGQGFIWEEGLEDRPWTSNRIKRVLERESAIGMGVKVNISIYRQIAIAITRRYLKGEGFIDDGDDEDGSDDEEGPSDIADSPFDVQAGHGSQMAGMIYARGVLDAPGHVSGMRQQFRMASDAWHRFLQFPSAIRGRGVKRSWQMEDQEQKMARWKRIRRMNVYPALEQIIGQGGQFRGIQEAAVTAIQAGESPILAIMGTGGGKSLLFMLPALCSAQIAGPIPGVTVVVTPMISLRQDLRRRCDAIPLRCVEWDSRRPASQTSIMLVTAESAISQAFQAYLNRLQANHQLDRIVIDECHTILDSQASFRPKLERLWELWVAECQVIMLTATLPPCEEPEFFHRFRIAPDMVQKFRASTSRPNIRYSVRAAAREAEAADGEVVQMVQQFQARYPDGKIIVYSSHIRRIERLAEMMDCPAYFRSVAAKTEVFERIMGPRCRVVIATNALGLGIDIPNIRVVMHIDGIRHLRDFAQESGRAGRDGQASESIVIHSQHGSPDARTQEWMAGTRCCRAILDEYLDGKEGRWQCEDGEEACWVCQARSGSIARSRQASPSGEEIVLPASPSDDGIFEQQGSQRARVREVAEVPTGSDTEQIEEFRQGLDEWGGICPYCRMHGFDAKHFMKQCSHSEPPMAQIRENIEQMQRKIRYERFSVCFRCGVPQWICQRFRENKQGGWVMDSGKDCQYHQVMIPVIITGMILYREFGSLVMDEMEGQGVDISSDSAVNQWFGRKIRWGGEEAAQVNRVFWKFLMFRRTVHDS